MKKAKLLGCGILCVLLIVTSIFILTGCNRGPSLRGLEIVIGNWWADYDTETFEPNNASDERILAWRTKIQQDNGFRMVERNIASWGELNDGFAMTSIMSGSPAATVFVLQGNWAMALIRQDLAKELNTDTLRNPQPVASGQMAPRWNQSTLNTFDFGGRVYAFSNDVNMTNAQVIFFNKRLFREAGLDPDLPYDMQRDGTWTWENFITICRQLTRDIDNDGIIDTYALPRDLSTEILNAVIASNGAQYVGRDPATGRFVNATNRPEFIEALQFAIRLNNEGIMKQPGDGANWDWFKSEFADGNVAMRVDESYVWGELAGMRDDWGVVLFPKGPRSANYRVFTRENVMIIPSTFSDTEAEQIMHALNLWYTPQDDDWKSGMYNTFRDSRAVDETLVLIRDTNNHIHKNFVLIPGLNIGNIGWSMWWHEGDPAQLVESVAPNWNALIDEVNAELFR